MNIQLAYSHLHGTSNKTDTSFSLKDVDMETKIGDNFWKQELIRRKDNICRAIIKGLNTEEHGFQIREMRRSLCVTFSGCSAKEYLDKNMNPGEKILSFEESSNLEGGSLSYYLVGNPNKKTWIRTAFVPLDDNNFLAISFD